MSQSTISPWFDDRIEAWLDGDLEGSEKQLFASQLAVDDALQREVELARNVSLELAQLPRYRCPEDMSQRLARMVEEPRSRRRKAWGLGLAASIAGVMTVSLWLKQGSDEPSAEELAMARKDLEVALAYLDHAGERASREIGQSIVTHGLAAPIRREVRHATDGPGAS